MKRMLLTAASALLLATSGSGLAFAGSNQSNASQSSMSTGQSSDEVRQAQQALQSEHLYNGQVDGIMGPQTRQALRQYQHQNGLKETAQLDQQTMQKLTSNQPTSAGSSGSGASSPSNAGTGHNNTNTNNH